MNASSNLSILIRKILVFLMPNASLLQRRLPNGVIFTGPNKPGHGGRGVFVYGNTLEPELDVLPHLLDKGHTFIDIGSNTGIYSLNAAHLVGDEGNVYSYDPNPEMTACLKHSAFLNAFNHVHVRTMCLSDGFRAQKFWMNSMKPHSFSLHKNDSADRYFTVLTMTLDQMMEAEALEGVSFIKIDAEGSEDEIISGAQDLIKRFRPIIQMESLQRTPSELEDYSAYQLPGSCNILAIPKDDERIQTVEGLGLEKLY